MCGLWMAASGSRKKFANRCHVSDSIYRLSLSACFFSASNLNTLLGAPKESAKAGEQEVDHSVCKKNGLDGLRQTTGLQ